MRARVLPMLGVLTCAAAAQPPAEAPSIDAGEALARIRSAYTAGPIGERIVIRVTDRSGRSSGSRVTVRLAGGPESVLRLDLGDLQVFAGDGVIRAAHRAEARLYAEWPLEAPLDLGQLERRLPPILLPQVAIALGSDAGLAAPMPLLPPVAWEGPAAPPRPPRNGRLTLSGSGAGVRVRMSVDPETWRLWRVVAELDAPAEVARIELQCTPTEPGDPATWRIPTLDRERVDDLTLLRPRAAEIAPGDAVGDLRLFDADLARWAPTPGADTLVLLAFRRTNGMAGGADAQADVEAGLLALAPLAREWNRGGPAGGLACRAVAVYDAESFDRESFRSLDALWSPAVSLAIGAGDRAERGLVAWAGGGAGWLARFRPGYQAAMIVVIPGEGGWRLAAAIPLDGRSEDPAGIADELGTALTPTR